MTTTTFTHTGRGDDFSVTARCSCGHEMTATLTDSGSFEDVFRAADTLDAAHQLARH
jgi:hypothetical protein